MVHVPVPVPVQVALVQGASQDGLQQLLLFLSLLITSITIGVVLGDWRLLLVFLVLYFVSISALVCGQMLTGSQEDRYKAQGQAVDEESAEAKTAGALVGEIVGAIRTVASFSAEQHFLERYRTVVGRQRSREGGRRMLLGSAAMGLGQGAAFAVFGSVLWYGFCSSTTTPHRWRAVSPPSAPTRRSTSARSSSR